MEIDYDRIVPVLRGLVEGFVKHCDYEFVIKYGNFKEDKAYRVQFIDPKHPEFGAERGHRQNAAGYAGALAWSSRDERYGVHSPLILNEKFGGWNDHRHANFSVDMRKVLSIAKKKIKPLEYAGIAMEYGRDAQTLLRDWINEPELYVGRMERAINTPVLFKELQNMKEKGYECLTPEFTQAMKSMQEARDEYIRRRDLKGEVKVVMQMQDGRVVVVSVGSTQQYPSMDQVPEHIAGKVAILKMSGENARIKEVGVRESENVFAILDIPEVNT